MKICWDNLENLKYNPKTKKWYQKRHVYIYIDLCKECNNPYLTKLYQQSDYCSQSCSNKNTSIDIRNKISKTLSILYEDKTNTPNYGKKFSEEHRNKIAKSNKGKILSQEHKRKLIENHADFSGENHWNWKGGISCESYCDQWKDKEYKESIKERDGYICLNPECNRNYKRLNIHHIDYNKKNCHPFNLITICASCNMKANKDRKWHKAWYQAIIDKRSKLYGSNKRLG